MDFENLMVTPAIYRDIPSSMMYSPYMMSPYMMPPLLGITGQISPMQPNLNKDTFQRLEAKDKESKNSMVKAGITLAALSVAGWFLSKRIALPSNFKNLFKKYVPSKDTINNLLVKFKNKTNTLYDVCKGKIATGTDSVKKSSWFGKIKNLFKN